MGTFVLVHGMGHGAWCWDHVVRQLQSLGHKAVAVELPLTSLDADAVVVRDALDSANEPVILVGHSYGGLVISRAAADHPQVVRLVYVAALLLARDEVLGDVAMRYPPSTLNGHSTITEDLAVVIDAEGAIAGFYNDCDPRVAAEAAARLRPTSLACVSSSACAEPWRKLPTTYVVCERDQAIHPEMQRWMSERATEVVVLETDHSPFLSTPSELAGLLGRLADAD
jgi:pimeloyl-ACP methyl ester carboxylesterase